MWDRPSLMLHQTRSIAGNPKYRYPLSMKTSIDLPDDLYRRVKARSAMEGRSVREVATSLFQQWVEGGVPAPVVRDEPPGASGDGTAPERLDPSAEAYLRRLDDIARDLQAAGVTGLTEQLLADRR
jgi:hypothetical protein